MKRIQRLLRTPWLSVPALFLAVGCGDGSTSDSSLSGVVATDQPITGMVVLTDSSTPSQSRIATMTADGRYRFDDVGGLNAPYLLRAEWMEGPEKQRMYSAAAEPGVANIDPMTDAAARGLSAGDSPDDLFARSDHGGKRRIAEQLRSFVGELRAALAPLLERYQCGNGGVKDGDALGRSELSALSRDVRFEITTGVLTAINKDTGGMIYSGPLVAVGSGILFPESLPPGCVASGGDQDGNGGEVPPPACTEFAYTAWGACASGVQMRTVTSSLPEGCVGGTPQVSQACTTQPQTCTAFTYSAWGTCSNGTQTRTVITSAPADCTGGAPQLTQACSLIDGSALYATYCSGCHGNSMKGWPASATQAAIDNNVGGMGSARLRALTPEEVAAIADAP